MLCASKSVQEFARVTQTHLQRREAEHCLLIGVSAELAANPRVYGSDPYLAAVVEREHVVAVALRTPPHNLLVSEVGDLAALGPLVEDVREAFDGLPEWVGRARRPPSSLACGRRREAPSRNGS